MRKKLFLKKQKLILFFLFMGSFVFGQTGWSIDQTFTPRIVKTRDFFFRVGKSNDKYYFAQDLDKKTLRQMNANGIVNDSYSIITNGNILAITEAQNGKTYVGGDFTGASNVFAPKIIRLNNDGTRDTTFLPDSNSQNVYSLQELSDGKLLVGRDGSIQRLNADGTTDNSFSTVTTNGLVQSFAVFPNGKILAGGSFTTINGSTKNRIVMLNSDGTVDSNFVIGTGTGINNGFNNDVYIVRLANDGSLFIGGKFTTFKGTTVNRIAKISNTGILDTAFHSGNTGFNNDVWTIEFMDDSNPLIGGLFTSYKGVNNNSILKINLNGNIDGSFDTGTADSNGYVYKIINNGSNNIFLSGTFLKYKSTFTNQAFIVNNDGSVNNSFNFDNRFCMPGIAFSRDFVENADYSYKNLPDGKILLGNVYYENKYYPLIRINQDGTRDISFNFDVSSLPTNQVIIGIRDLEIRPNGKIVCSAVAGGDAFSGPHKKFVALFQLNTDGSYDNSFNTGIVEFDSSWGFPITNKIPTSMVLQDDGKVLFHINHAYSYKGYNANPGVIRILENGNLDLSFQNTAGTFDDGDRTKMLLLSNGQILIHSTLQSNSGYGPNPNNNYYSMVLLNADGTLAHKFPSLDLYFSGSTTYLPHINNVKEIDGKLLVMGNFNGVNGFSSKGLVEVNFNGNPTKYFPNLGITIKELSGVYDIEKHNNRYYIMINRSFNTFVYSPPIDPLTDYANYNYSIIRTNLDGISDSAFSEIIIPAYKKNFKTTYANLSQYIDGDSRSPQNLNIAFTAPNYLTIFGTYSVFRNESHFGLSRIIIPDANMSTSDNFVNQTNVKIYPNPTKDIVFIESNDIINSLEIYDMQGKVLKKHSNNNKKAQITIQNLPNSIYLVKVKTDKGIQTFKVIKN